MPTLNFQPIRSWSSLLIQIHILNDKQWRSRSVGFFRSQLIWIYTVWKGRIYAGSALQGLKDLLAQGFSLQQRPDRTLLVYLLEEDMKNTVLTLSIQLPYQTNGIDPDQILHSTACDLCLEYLLRYFCYLICLKTAGWVTKSVEPDQMLHSVASSWFTLLLRPVCLNTLVNMVIFENTFKHSTHLDR